MQNAKETVPKTSDAFVESLNEELTRGHQAIIASVVYSQVLKGAEYINIAQELEKLAAHEFQHALAVAKRVDHLGGAPILQRMPIQLANNAKAMLRGDLRIVSATI